MTKKLTELQEEFCRQNLVCDFNATAAYKAAGGTAKHADRAAHALMKVPEVKARIDELKAKRAEKTGIDAEYVLKQADELLQQCMGKKPINKVVYKDGDYDSAEVYEFNAAGAGKALDLLGKHVDVQAFKERVEHSGHITHEEMLEQLQ